VRKGLCNCVAIYDWKGEIDPLQWYRTAVEYFQALGVEPDLGSFGRTAKKKRPIQFKSLNKKILSADSSNIESITLYLTIPDYVQLVFGWTVTAGFSIGGRTKTVFFCFDDTVRTFDHGFLLELIGELSESCEVTYGIAYQRPFELGPAAYALGAVVGLDYGDEDAHLIGDWFRERMGRNRHVRGLLRDVYPLNFLSRPHLETPVDGQPLADWIEAAPGRGELAPFADGLWCWSIPQQSLEDLRAILRPRGLLIAGHPETGDHG